MDESERADLELRWLSHVDVSSENDAPIVASSASTSTFCDHQSTENQNNNISSELLEAANAEKAVDKASVSSQTEQLPQPSEPLVPERTRKIGKCNLRKSLAWDNAFFTSAGVLDPDELSSMIKVVHIGGKHVLPGIEEDMRRSTDSISTLVSESLTLESLEADLFEDIRASIQKSSKASNTASSSKAASGETETQVVSSLKKVDCPSKNMAKPKPASKKQNIGMQGPGKSIKQSSVCSQVTEPVARNGGPNSSLQKTPKVIGRPNPISSAPLKRASLSANQVKTENNAKRASVAGKVAPASKISGLGAIRTLPKPALSLKSSSSSSSTATKKELPKSSSSSDISCGASSANVGISPMKSTRRKIDSRTVNPTSSSSILKTPFKVVLKNKGQSGLSACLMSSKLSSNISPASSISEWSSESSSLGSVNQRSNTSRASIDTSSPCRSLDNDAPRALDHHKQCDDQIADRHENKATRLPCENVKTASMQIGALSRPATVKPSGLRKPSPKIGFFDGVKPGVRTPNGSVQSYSGITAGPKIGPGINSPSGGSSKAKFQPARVVTTIGNMKLDTQKPASPVSSRKLSIASTKVFGALGGVKNCLSVKPQVQYETDGESCLKAEEVGPKGPIKANDVPDPGVLKSEMDLGNTNLKDVKTATIEGDARAKRSHCNAPNNNLHSLYKSNEEIAHFEDQVDGVSMHVGAGDPKQELQKDLIGNSISQIGLSHPDSGQKEESPSNLLEPTPISLSPVTFEIMARTPFAVKNTFCNGEGGLDLSAGLKIGVVEKTTYFPSLESARTENS